MCSSLREIMAYVDLMVHLKERCETSNTTFSNSDGNSLMELYRGHSNTKHASLSTTLCKQKWHNLSSLETSIYGRSLSSFNIKSMGNNVWRFVSFRILL